MQCDTTNIIILDIFCCKPIFTIVVKAMCQLMSHYHPDGAIT